MIDLDYWSLDCYVRVTDSAQPGGLTSIAKFEPAPTTQPKNLITTLILQYFTAKQYTLWGGGIRQTHLDTVQDARSSCEEEFVKSYT